MMTTVLDPSRQARCIQQALAPDKMPVALFLGAGCPLAVRIPPDDAPLIPGIQGLTTLVCDQLATDPNFKKHSSLIQTHLKSDGFTDPTVEDMLSHIRTLMQAAGNDKARGLCGKQLRDLDDKICGLIDACVRKRLPDCATPYHRTANWVNAIPRKYPVEIFTTNYDLLMEQAFEEQGVPYFDGFVGSDRTFFDPPSMELEDLPARWARLWKLHGSINWRQHVDTKVVSRGENVLMGERRLIHPSHLKYDESRRMPYLAMMDRLRAFFRRSPAVLVIIGYSFSDQHINEVIVQGLQGNPTAICFALMYGNLDCYPRAVKCATHRTNLCVLAENEGISGCVRGKWSVPTNPNDFKSAVTVRSDPTAGDIARFTLGDFGQLAHFLVEQIGTDYNTPGGAYAL